MGVINLGNIVSKLKNSLSGTFVKNTDKATKSAFGIVKIGDNINVSSGKISVPVATAESYGVVKTGDMGSGIQQIYFNDVSGTSGNVSFTWPDLTGKTIVLVTCAFGDDGKNTLSFSTTATTYKMWVQSPTGLKTTTFNKTETGLSWSSGANSLSHLAIYVL